MNCIITLHNNKVIQGKVNIRTERVAGRDNVILDIRTRKNKYSINMHDCKKILFKEHDNNEQRFSEE